MQFQPLIGPMTASTYLPIQRTGDASMLNHGKLKYYETVDKSDDTNVGSVMTGVSTQQRMKRFTGSVISLAHVHTGIPAGTVALVKDIVTGRICSSANLFAAAYRTL